MSQPRRTQSTLLWVLLGVLLIDVQLFMYAGQNYSAPLAPEIAALTLLVFLVVLLRMAVELYVVVFDPA